MTSWTLFKLVFETIAFNNIVFYVLPKELLVIKFSACYCKMENNKSRRNVI